MIVFVFCSNMLFFEFVVVWSCLFKKGLNLLWDVFVLVCVRMLVFVFVCCCFDVLLLCVCLCACCYCCCMSCAVFGAVCFCVCLFVLVCVNVICCLGLYYSAVFVCVKKWFCWFCVLMVFALGCVCLVSIDIAWSVCLCSNLVMVGRVCCCLSVL